MGAYDEVFRHAITKMSHLHFVAAKDYETRVIQLGENPNKVFCVGGLGTDSIRRIELFTKKELSEQLGWLISFELKCLGIDVNTAPVLDIDYGNSEIMKKRCFPTLYSI